MPVSAAELTIPTARLDQSRLEGCADEAVRWSLADENMSDGIYVDGTRKFGHIRIDGYARHWDTPIWAFVSNPTDARTGQITVIIGYVDPLNDKYQEKNLLKIDGMRRILGLCLHRR